MSFSGLRAFLRSDFGKRTAEALGKEVRRWSGIKFLLDFMQILKSPRGEGACPGAKKLFLPPHVFKKHRFKRGGFLTILGCSLTVKESVAARFWKKVELPPNLWTRPQKSALPPKPDTLPFPSNLKLHSFSRQKLKLPSSSRQTSNFIPLQVKLQTPSSSFKHHSSTSFRETTNFFPPLPVKPLAFQNRFLKLLPQTSCSQNSQIEISRVWEWCLKPENEFGRNQGSGSKREGGRVEILIPLRRRKHWNGKTTWTARRSCKIH